MGNHTVITTSIFKTTRLKKSRVSQESVQSLFHQWILVFQIVATIAVVLNLRSQRVEKGVALWIIDAATSFKCLGEVKEALLCLKETDGLLCHMLVASHLG
jgi:hypothetical protein